MQYCILKVQQEALPPQCTWSHEKLWTNCSAARKRRWSILGACWHTLLTKVNVKASMRRSLGSWSRLGVRPRRSIFSTSPERQNFQFFTRHGMEPDHMVPIGTGWKTGYFWETLLLYIYQIIWLLKSTSYYPTPTSLSHSHIQTSSGRFCKFLNRFQKVAWKMTLLSSWLAISMSSAATILTASSSILSPGEFGNYYQSNKLAEISLARLNFMSQNREGKCLNLYFLLLSTETNNAVWDQNRPI